jgi:hypothetical protein
VYDTLPQIKLVYGKLDAIATVAANTHLGDVADLSLKVELVYDLQDQITRLDASRTAITRLHTSIDNIDDIHPHISSISTLATKTSELSLAASASNSITGVSDYLSQINALSGQLSQIGQLAPLASNGVLTHLSGNIGVMENVLDLSQELIDFNDAYAAGDVNAVLSNLPVLNTVFSNLNAINSVYSSLGAINVLAPNYAKLDSLYQNYTTINEVHGALPAILGLYLEGIDGGTF